VAWTLDSSGIIGQVGLQLETGQTGPFILHLNFSDKIKSIRLFLQQLRDNSSLRIVGNNLHCLQQVIPEIGGRSGMMRKRTIPVIAAIFILVVPVLLMTGCPLHNDSFYGARVTVMAAVERWRFTKILAAGIFTFIKSALMERPFGENGGLSWQHR